MFNKTKLPAKVINFIFLMQLFEIKDVKKP